MSICFTIDVMCDGDDGHCLHWTDGAVQWHNITGTKAEARKAAKKAGWKRIKGKDYCPKCLSSKIG